MKRIFKEIKTVDLHGELRTLWYSKDKELETEVFTQFPEWMDEKDPNDEITKKYLKKELGEQLLTLTPREQKILYMRFWLDMTFAEIGFCFSLSKDRIMQIEQKSLRKLKHPSKSEHLVDYAPWEGLKNSKPFKYPYTFVNY